MGGLAIGRYALLRPKDFPGGQAGYQGVLGGALFTSDVRSGYYAGEYLSDELGVHSTEEGLVRRWIDFGVGNEQLKNSKGHVKEIIQVWTTSFDFVITPEGCVRGVYGFWYDIRKRAMDVKSWVL